jgi:hypothetical protein
MVRMVDEEMEVIVDFCMGSTVVHARVTGAVDINPKAKQLASLAYVSKSWIFKLLGLLSKKQKAAFLHTY